MQAIPNMRIIWGDKKLFLCAKDKIVSFAEKKRIVNTTNGSCASKTWHPLLPAFETGSSILPYIIKYEGACGAPHAPSYCYCCAVMSAKRRAILTRRRGIMAEMPVYDPGVWGWPQRQYAAHCREKNRNPTSVMPLPRKQIMNGNEVSRLTSWSV